VIVVARRSLQIDARHANDDFTEFHVVDSGTSFLRKYTEIGFQIKLLRLHFGGILARARLSAAKALIQVGVVFAVR
jgi:hypothetical protein